MSDIKPIDKKISKIKIVYEDESLPPEDALIYIPISQVEGLENQLSWTVIDNSSQK